MAEEKDMMSRFLGLLKEIGKDTIFTAGVLVKVTVPVIIITRVLEELGLIVYLSRALEPIMSIMGLPGELGLVWATGLMTSLYGALAVFAALAPGLDLTTAQATVLGSILLFAHSLPVELSISQKAGAGLLPIGLLRMGSAIIFGVGLNWICSGADVWQEPIHLYFKGGGAEQGLGPWVVAQASNLVLIFFVIFCILAAMRLFRAIGVLGLLERLLEPVLPMLGMTRRAAPVTVVGMIVGIGYGGALIIRETTQGNMNRREVFNSLALMAMSHGLIEDTLLMMAMGAKLGGILWGRLLFSLVVLYFIVKLTDFIHPERVKERTGTG